MKRWRAIEKFETNNFAFTHFFSFIHFIRLCIVYYFFWSSIRRSSGIEKILFLAVSRITFVAEKRNEKKTGAINRIMIQIIKVIA